ncbi:hypothetical protein BJ322DRAFT_1156844 [Thelephora terrestris]|uniref:NACHT domain-containing protein n=1 Tax=Thelephora terrestris TaxID=56493 RepID=A0A9P6L5W9_9AGAM|nr:hypothetical protein BJ322DRAFT_1156844 [Thelephora terrestris]
MDGTNSCSNPVITCHGSGFGVPGANHTGWIRSKNAENAELARVANLETFILYRSLRKRHPTNLAESCGAQPIASTSTKARGRALQTLRPERLHNNAVVQKIQEIFSAFSKLCFFIPTHIAAGPLGIGAELNPDVGPEGSNGGRGFRIVNRGIVSQQPEPSGVSTATPGFDDTIMEHEREVPLDAPNERSGLIARDLSPTGQREPGVRNEGENQDRGTSAERPPQAPAEVASQSVQLGENAQETVQSGGSKLAGRDWKDTAIGIVGIASDIAMGVAEAFSPLKATLATISAGTAAVKDKIVSLSLRITTLEKVFEKPTDDEAEKARRKELQSIEETLRSLHQKSMILRITNHVQDNEEVSGLLEDLREAISDYQMVQQMAIYNQGCKLIKSNISEQDAAEMAILNNFRRAQGAGYQHAGRKGCLKGTRKTVLDEIELWAKDFEKLPVYWLNGLAGTGKSTIAQTIAERMFAEGQLGASFFCSRNFEDRSNLHSIFPTIAVQLARKYAEFRSILVPLVHSDPEIVHESLYNQMDKLIVRPLQETSLSTIIVIDALDECKDEEPASAILSVLARFVTQVPKVKFFLTGRPEPRIQEGFRLPLLVDATNTFILHEVQTNQINSDIQQFFQSSFLELAFRHTGLDNWPTKEQLDLICKRAAGLFVYAVATVKFINTRNYHPRERLDLLLQLPDSTVHEGKTKFNSNTSLDSLYRSILQEAFSHDGAEDDPRIHSILGAVILVANPLSPSAISTLLGIHSDYVTPPLLSIHSLLILHEDINQPVRPFHKSFPDFITDPTRCTNQRFYISPSHHLDLLVCCLNLMNNTLEKNMCQLPEAVANSEVHDLQERADKNISQALQYACKSWHKHLVNDPTDKITSALRCFLEKKFLSWLEVLSVLGAVRNAVDALKVVAEWLQETSLLDLTNDCLRFVMGFFEVISTSAPHIHHSALPLSPKESIVQRYHGSQADPLTTVICGGQTVWDPNIANVKFPERITATGWSPCSKFFAVAWDDSPKIAILDAVTLKQLYTIHSQSKGCGWATVAFSSDSHLLAGCCWKSNRVVTWDLQTGGVISDTKGAGHCNSMSFSECGTMLGGLFGQFDLQTIMIYKTLSNTCISSHPVQGPALDTIWTCGEYLQFATVDSQSIIIWQVSFTSGHTPTKVGSLSTPEIFSIPKIFPSYRLVLLHTLSWLAFIVEGRVVVWDAQNDRVLLNSVDAEEPTNMSFSSGGEFLICGTRGTESYLWMKSPDGYLPHQKLVSSGTWTHPLVSPNGESVISSGYSGTRIQLWNIANSPTPFSSVSAQASHHHEDLLVDFSADGSLIAVAVKNNHTLTILSIKSGAALLVIDAETMICSVKMTDNEIVVIGDGKIVTWNLSRKDSDLHVDRVQTVAFQHSESFEELWASVAPNLKYLAIRTFETSSGLCVYNMHDGEKLAVARSAGWIPGFTPDSCGVWNSSNRGDVNQWTIVEESGSNGIKLQQVETYTAPQDNFPWHSSCGYQLTDDGRILSSSGKQLLWLPHHWRPDHKLQVRWSRNILVVWNENLPDPIILKLEV